MIRQRSDIYAPYGTCDRCGWSGKDWAFKYQGLCSKCYKQWRKERAEESRRLKPPNENVQITDGIIITKNVHVRLEKEAHSDVPLTRSWHYADLCEGIGYFLSLISMLVLVFTLYLHPWYIPFLIIFAILGFIMAFVSSSVQKAEAAKRQPKVTARLEELARERQKRIEEAKTFYASAEWRLIREQVIEEQKHVCQICGCRITIDNDLTVDHIKPRSKFPELALDKSNLQVLCRRCNSSKGATYDESSITNDESISETVKNIEFK